ncbi:hypothetical protein TRFO_25654 [Tritrichomonas foetus]|uniref:Uncharacterized protein n=1 Tax=Tritrichomonas foetus TaxID=1144522 RepID=A0A1J4K608_9EUKA|nr:hypothetical protein TRFO_25654 [Tritrichomonas foetus]|eukprot:OHT06312.1 hypothetical protein TRFO_25654 [Tritrichomonas foetus]
MDPKSYFSDVITLQNKMMDLDNSNISDFIEYSKVNFSQSKSKVLQLLISLRSLATARPFILMFARTIIFEFHEEIVTFFASDELTKIFLGNNSLLLALFDIGAVTIDSILKYSDSLNTFKFFFEQIQSNKNDYFCSKVDQIPMLYYFCQKIKYEEHHLCQIEGNNAERIAASIRFDDLNNFQYFTRSRPFNSKIMYSIYDTNGIVSCIWKMPTFLEYAAFYGSSKVFNYLLRLYDENDLYPEENVMEYAVAGGDREIIHQLEERNMTFTVQCLKNSITYFNKGIYDYIIRNSTNSEELSSYEIIFDSLSSYNIQSFMTFFTKDKLFLKNENNETLLHIAVKNGYYDIVEFLLNEFRDFDINAQDSYQRTPFLVSIMNENFEIMKLLFNQKSNDKNITDSLGQNALHYAAAIDNIEIFKYLLDKIPTIEDKVGNLPLHSAAIHGKLKILEFILENNFQSVYLLTKQKQTIMHLAAGNGHLDLVDYFIFIFQDEIGDFVNQPDKNGQTALHLAAINGKLDVVQALAGINEIKINITDVNVLK